MRSFVHKTLLFLENPLDRFSAEGLLSKKAQFYDSRPILPSYSQIRFLTLVPSTCGHAHFTTTSSMPGIISLKNYNSVDAEQSLVNVHTFLSLMRPIVFCFFFSSACLPTVLGNADVGCFSSQIRDFPCGRLQVEPVATRPLLKMSELQN